MVEIENPSALLKAAIYAYWYVPEASADQLALFAVGKRSAAIMLKRSEVFSIDFPCECCGKDLAITSRTMMREALMAAAGGSQASRGWRLICANCRQNLLEEREHELYKREREERRQFLARISYAEYLTTLEWHARRRGVISAKLEWGDIPPG